MLMELAFFLFQVFTDMLASWLASLSSGPEPANQVGDALHFFVEDVSKILPCCWS